MPSPMAMSPRGSTALIPVAQSFNLMSHLVEVCGATFLAEVCLGGRICHDHDHRRQGSRSDVSEWTNPRLILMHGLVQLLEHLVELVDVLGVGSADDEDVFQHLGGHVVGERVVLPAG